VHAEAAEGFHRRALGLLQQAGRPEAGERRLQFLSLAVEVPPLPPERLTPPPLPPVLTGHVSSLLPY